MIETLQTFGLILAELLVLFSVISVVVALINRRFGSDRIQQWMADGRLPGPVKGLLLGAITPFCSCSTLPVLAGMLKSGVAFRTAMTFLISSPLLDPIIIAGVVILFGWRVSIAYTIVTAVWTLFAPVLWDRLGLSQQVKRVKVISDEETQTPWRGLRAELRPALAEAWSDLRPLLFPMLIGVAIGACIYGFVPQDQLANIAGDGKPWSVPLAAVIGIPLYVRVETMLPIGLALRSAGVGLGAVFALMIGGAGASIPEVSMLTALFKPRLVAAFVVTVIGTAIAAGYLIPLAA